MTDRRNIASILNGCLKRDRKCQNELYRQLYGFAMKVCCPYTTDNEECVELVNESFLKLFKNFQLTEPSDSATRLLLKAQFKQILINTCVDYYHKTGRNGSHCGGDSTGKLSDTEPMEAIRSLPSVYRMVFNLFVIEGLSHIEISKMLDISENASQVYLTKARAYLKKILLNNNML